MVRVRNEKPGLRQRSYGFLSDLGRFGVPSHDLSHTGYVLGAGNKTCIAGEQQFIQSFERIIFRIIIAWVLYIFSNIFTKD